MKVECMFTDGSQLPQEYYSIGYTERSKFDTTLGVQYSVYAVAIMKQCLMYLICDDFNVPNWYPASSFRLTERNLSSNWQFMYFNEDEYLSMMMGYPEIVKIKNHYVGLIERETEALSIFGRAKLEMDALLN